MRPALTRQLRERWNLFAVLLFVVVGTPADMLAQPEQSVGFVLEIFNGWTVNGAEIRIGQSLPPGGEVKAVRTKGRQGVSRLAIVFLDSTVIQLECAKDKPCDPYRLPMSLVPSSSLFERICAAGANLFGRQPERYIPAITRSGDSTKPLVLEGVLELLDGELEVAPLMNYFSDGDYALSFRRPTDDPGSVPVPPVALNWESGRQEQSVTVKLFPGLYSVTVRSLTDADAGCRTENAWVLIVGGAGFEVVDREFRQIRDGVQAWDGVSEAGRRSFLRIALETLAERHP